MVTSRAVVGSSAISSLGLQARAIAMTTLCFHTALKTGGDTLQNALLGTPTPFQHVFSPFSGLLPGQAGVVVLDYLHDLLAYHREHRVQGRS